MIDNATVVVFNTEINVILLLALSLISAMASRAGSAKVSKREAKSKREQEKQRAYRKNKLFRRIEADIKERDRKRIPGNRERSLFEQSCQPHTHTHTTYVYYQQVGQRNM